MTDYRETTGTGTNTGDREVIEQANATVKDFDYLVPPDSEGFLSIELENGLMYVSGDDPNHCTPGHQDVFNPTGAIAGAATAGVAGAAAGSAVGTVALPVVGTVGVGTVAGLGAAAGSLAGSAYEAVSGALSYTVNVIVDGEIRGAAVACVPVSGPFGTTKKDISFNFETPTEPGDYDVDIVVATTNTGALIKRINTSITVDPQTSEDPAVQNNNQNNSPSGGGSNLSRWVMNNPVKAGAIGLGGIVVLRTGTESAITGE